MPDGKLPVMIGKFHHDGAGTSPAAGPPTPLTVPRPQRAATGLRNNPYSTAWAQAEAELRFAAPTFATFLRDRQGANPRFPYQVDTDANCRKKKKKKTNPELDFVSRQVKPVRTGRFPAQPRPRQPGLRGSRLRTGRPRGKQRFMVLGPGRQAAARRQGLTTSSIGATPLVDFKPVIGRHAPINGNP